MGRGSVRCLVTRLTFARVVHSEASLNARPAYRNALPAPLFGLNRLGPKVATGRNFCLIPRLKTTSCTRCTCRDIDPRHVPL